MNILPAHMIGAPQPSTHVMGAIATSVVAIAPIVWMGFNRVSLITGLKWTGLDWTGLTKTSEIS